VTLSKPAHEVIATVLGAGTMGAGIAAHLANAGCKTFLLDIVPPQAPEGAPAAVRSAIAAGALKALAKAKPPALMSAGAAERITPGNLQDDLERAVAQSDLVIEAVVERLDVKRQLFARVAAAAKPDAVLATNTSGIPIGAIAEALPADVRGRFLGLHFFNPPRWMHLLEVIPGADTDPAIVSAAGDFCDRLLGKGVVECRDTPNFIGNRIGIAEMLLTFRAALEGGYTVEEVDFLNGPLFGRPKTGSFRLGDLVGLDVVAHVVKNLEENLNGDPGSPAFDPLYDLMRVPEVLSRLVEKKLLGDKTGAGFYKKSRGASGKTEILSLDLATLEYRSRQEPAFGELERLAKLVGFPARVGEALRSEGRGGEFLRRVYLPLFNYSAALVGRICDTPQQIDEAMCWGYGWQLGPFALMDAAGVAWAAEAMEKAGLKPAEAIGELLKQGKDATWYGKDRVEPTVYVPHVGQQPVAVRPGILLLDRLKAAGRELKTNPTAGLIDLGDGIACLEFRSKANILDEGVVAMITEAPEFLASKGFRGLVVGNQADHFCRGANLMQIAGWIVQKDWKSIERAVKALQDGFMNLRHGPVPVVAAPLGQTLGGGTEVCLHCAEIQAGADLFLGLVEVGVGLLPAAGGLKEICRRASEWASQVPDQDPYPWVRRGFEAVATAKVSMSAFEARETGFLSAQDGITFHKSRVIADAKRRALALAEKGWVPPDRNQPIRVIGAPGGASMMLGVQLFEWAGYATEYDKFIGKKIVHVLSGGMPSAPKTVVAQDLLDLELEAFLSLTAEPRTFDRIKHMLETKKPLRN
jgi:3-hydroxyacyl-CoA dehydrogenase